MVVRSLSPGSVKGDRTFTSFEQRRCARPSHAWPDARRLRQHRGADGSGILFLSRRASAFYHQYDTFVVRASGGLAVSLGLGPSGFSSLSADGHQIAFDRTFRNLAGDRWKHYVGGQAPDVFIYDFTRSSLQRLTDWKGLDTAPMWSGRRIYYLSDRGPEGRANLRSTDLDTRRARQITFFRDLDVDVPSIGPGGIAFQHGGRVYRLDLPSERVSEVRVTVPEQPRMAAHDIAVERFVSRSDYAASNAGAILVARGDLFTLAAGGKVRNLTRTSAVVLSISKPSPMKFCWR